MRETTSGSIGGRFSRGAVAFLGPVLLFLAAGCTSSADLEQAYRDSWAQTPSLQEMFPQVEDYVTYGMLLMDDPAAATAFAQKKTQHMMQNLQPSAAQLAQGALPAVEIDVEAVFEGVPKPNEPVDPKDQALADELFAWGAKRIQEMPHMATAAAQYPNLHEANCASWGVMALGRRHGKLDPERSEQAFRLLFRRALRANDREAPFMKRGSFQRQIRYMAGSYYQTTQQAAKLVPYHKALIRLGDVLGSPLEKFRGNAGLANYAYTIGQREAFTRYASKAIEFAADACKGKGSEMSGFGADAGLENMPEDVREMMRGMMKGAGKSRTDVELFPDLGLLARQLADTGEVEGLKAFGKVALESDDLSGQICYQLALALGRVGRDEEARVLVKRAPKAYRDQIMGLRMGPTPGGNDTMKPHEVYLRARSKGEAQLVPLVLAHYRGEGSKSPWRRVAAIARNMWKARLESEKERPTILQEFRSREKGLVSNWPALAKGFGLELSEARVRAEAAPFLLEEFFEVSPLIESLEKEDPDLAIALYLVGVSSQERARKGVDLEDRARLFDALKSRTLYRGLLRTLALRGKPGDAERALAVSELSRARQLKELLAGEVAREVTSLSEPLELARKLKARLEKDQALVAYHLLPKHLLVLSLTNSGARASLRPLDRRAFSARVSGLHQALANPKSNDVGERLLAISRPLLTPLTKILANKRKLFALPDGVLHTLPFDVLPGPSGAPLLESIAVSVLPSCESLLKSRGKGTGATPKFFAVADPVYPKLASTADAASLDVEEAKTRGASGIPALPETRTEVEAIAKQFGRSRLLLGEEALESLIKRGDLSGYSHVHFATHGVLAYELPNVTEPSLILSAEPGEDSFLSASEASRLKLKADVCVLSACNTGSGKVLNGEGVLGLSRAFLIAGSRTVLVSLWPVASEATRDLMIRFYHHARPSSGLSKAEALRLAKLEVARSGVAGSGTRGFGGVVSGKRTTPVSPKGDGQHPFFWAPFVLVGAD